MKADAQRLDAHGYTWKLPSNDSDTLDLTLMWGQISGQGGRILTNVHGNDNGIATTHTLIQNIDVRCYDGSSHFLHLRDESVLVRRGHEVALIVGRNRHTGECAPVALYNTVTNRWAVLETPLNENHGDLGGIRRALAVIIGVCAGIVVGHSTHDAAAGVAMSVFAFLGIMALGWLFVQVPTETVRTVSLTHRLQPIMNRAARGEFAYRRAVPVIASQQSRVVTPNAQIEMPDYLEQQCLTPRDAEVYVRADGSTEYIYADGRREPGAAR